MVYDHDLKIRIVAELNRESRRRCFTCKDGVCIDSAKHSLRLCCVKDVEIAYDVYTEPQESKNQRKIAQRERNLRAKNESVANKAIAAAKKLEEKRVASELAQTIRTALRVCNEWIDRV